MNNPDLLVKSIPYDTLVCTFLENFLVYEGTDLWTSEEYLTKEQPKFVYGAFLKDTLVGVACYNPTFKKWRDLRFLAVSSHHRRKLIGATLITHVFKNTDCIGIYVYPEIVNPPGIKFYEKLGFVKEKHSKIELHYFTYSVSKDKYMNHITS